MGRGVTISGRKGENLRLSRVRHTGTRERGSAEVTVTLSWLGGGASCFPVITVWNFSHDQALGKCQCP